jgi:hypothetical protein
VRTRYRRGGRLAGFIAALLPSAWGCNTLLDAGRYHAVAGIDSGGALQPDAAPVDDAAPDEAVGPAPFADATNCSVDLTTQCYPCAPTTPRQFLGACTSATCVPFDDTVRLTRMLPDGALPPLPGTSN